MMDFHQLQLKQVRELNCSLTLSFTDYYWIFVSNSIFFFFHPFDTINYIVLFLSSLVCFGLVWPSFIWFDGVFCRFQNVTLDKVCLDWDLKHTDGIINFLDRQLSNSSFLDHQIVGVVVWLVNLIVVAVSGKTWYWQASGFL